MGWLNQARFMQRTTQLTYLMQVQLFTILEEVNYGKQ